MADLSSKPEERIMKEYEGQEFVWGMRNQEGQTVSLFPGAMDVFRYILTAEEMQGIKIGVASSSPIPINSYACLENLEIFPGKPISKVISVEQIGKKGGDAKYKHFENIRDETGYDFSEMMFFDDCGHEDHVTMIYEKFGVIGEATPDGLTMEHLRSCLEKFEKARQ
eukprot:Mrub_10398.p2 GENE.Mrub_10398~~Mrub_10398.p2  ORF type:complete len:167 (+),score=47.21 Mrub_10398:112-612(+)